MRFRIPHTPVRASRFVLAWASLACTRAHETAPADKLPLQAALPSQFSRETTLRIGDPTLQKQLALNGELTHLPFTAEWHNVVGGLTPEVLMSAALTSEALTPGARTP